MDPIIAWRVSLVDVLDGMGSAGISKRWKGKNNHVGFVATARFYSRITLCSRCTGVPVYRINLDSSPSRRIFYVSGELTSLFDDPGFPLPHPPSLTPPLGHRDELPPDRH